MKKIILFIWETAKIVIVALAIVIPIRYFLFQPFFVKGQSMEPNFENGDYLIVDEISYRFSSPKRGDIIVFKFPQDTSQRLIKRVIGLPGEIIEIKDNKIIIYKDGIPQVLNESNYLPLDFQTKGNIKIILEKDEYFVLGDNRDFSFDSRKFGILPKEEIIGRVFLRAWPLSAFTKFKTPDYKLEILNFSVPQNGELESR